MFDDKLMADSKVSAVGDINIPPRTQKGRSSLRQKPPKCLWKNSPTMVRVAFKCNFPPRKDGGDVSYGALLIESK